MVERKVKAWITINGVHVPIYEGESKEDAAKRAISKAQENIKKNESDKEKDIKRNIMEKSSLNDVNKRTKELHRLDKESKERGDNIEPKLYKDNEKYFVPIEDEKNDPTYKEFNKDIGKELKNGDSLMSHDITGKQLRSLKDGDTINLGDGVEYRKENGKWSTFIDGEKSDLTPLNDYDAYLALTNYNDSKKISIKSNKDNFRNASAGKASDEARVKKETASDYDKEFGTVGKVDINNVPSAQLMKRLNDLSLGDEPVGKFWDKSAELYSVYKQLYSVANQKDSGFKFTKQNDAAMYQYGRYYNDGDLPGWARGQFNEFAQWNRKWNRTELSPRGELELERRANAVVVAEYKRYQKFINTVPKSFAANYPNLSSSELKKKYQEYLKKNRK